MLYVIHVLLSIVIFSSESFSTTIEDHNEHSPILKDYDIDKGSEYTEEIDLRSIEKINERREPTLDDFLFVISERQSSIQHIKDNELDWKIFISLYSLWVSSVKNKMEKSVDDTILIASLSSECAKGQSCCN